jgi:hypothetical protein
VGEARRLLDALGELGGPMPDDDASDAAWEAWSDAQEFEAMATGMLSRPVEPRDASFVAALRALLAKPGLRDLLGDRVDLAEQLVAALHNRQ